jgi:bacillolysin
MKPRGLRLFSCLLLSFWCGLAAAQPAPANKTAVFAAEPAEALAWDAKIRALEAAGELERVAVEEESVAPGWLHERFQQRHRGLRVFGAQLLRHSYQGNVVTVNGQVYADVRIDTTAGMGPDAAALAAARAEGSDARPVGKPELLIYPRAETLTLAYRLHLRRSQDLQLYFVDAASGAILDHWSDLRRQAVVGKGTGTWQDEKKVSTTQSGALYLARDGLRPAVALTVDVQGDYQAWNFYQINPATSAARDDDNDWRDGAVVDAHVYAGWSYDYYFKRFGRRGLDGSDLRVVNYVHFWLRQFGRHPFLNNAFWDPLDNSINYGDGDGMTYNFFSGTLDVAGHEFTHGVTQYSSDLIYRDESGALDESFSDIMGIAIEFFFEPRSFGRQRADRGQGEDLFIGSFRGEHLVRVSLSTRSACGSRPRSLQPPLPRHG